MNRTFKLLWALILVLSAFSGCADKPGAAHETQASSGIKSDGYEKFCQLEISMTEIEVTDILGQPTRRDKTWCYYTVTVNGHDLDLTLCLDSGTGRLTYAGGNFSDSLYRAEFADSRTDLSAASKLENHQLTTYDDCAAAFKTPGYRIGMDQEGVKEYLWVDEGGGYMRIAFRSDGTVKSFRGIC